MLHYIQQAYLDKNGTETGLSGSGFLYTSGKAESFVGTSEKIMSAFYLHIELIHWKPSLENI